MMKKNNNIENSFGKIANIYSVYKCSCGNRCEIPEDKLYESNHYCSECNALIFDLEIEGEVRDECGICKKVTPMKDTIAFIVNGHVFPVCTKCDKTLKNRYSKGEN